MDRVLDIQAGIYSAWQAEYDSGEIVREYTEQGHKVLLKTLDVPRIVKWSAYVLSSDPYSPVILTTYLVPKGFRPYWTHSAIGLINSNGYTDLAKIVDVIGVENEEGRKFLTKIDQGKLESYIE